MIRRPHLAAVTALALALLAGCGSGSGATPPGNAGTGCPTSQPAPLGAGETRTVTLQTAKGNIAIKVEASLAPIAAGNFVALASCGFYDEVVFQRVVPGFVIQGGDGKYGRSDSIDRQRVGSGGPPGDYRIQDEPVTAMYGRGTVAMARSAAPNSAGAQFFIVLSDDAASSLTLTEPGRGYAIFGTVTAGMEAVDAIAAAADAEQPSSPIAMTKVTVASP